MFILRKISIISAFRDIENAHPELKHLWIEVPGRKKYSRALVGCDL